MDRIKDTANVIRCINKHRNGELFDHVLIQVVCDYFDNWKSESLFQNNQQFLYYIANYVGIPHYYDLLNKYSECKDFANFDLNTLSAVMHESSLYTGETAKCHRYQKQVIDKFITEHENRFFISASTSFGKTFLVYEIIRKMQYKNIVLIFPTIALLSENLEKILTNEEYAFIKNDYTIHTLSDQLELGTKNIFIYTPERYLSFIDKVITPVKFDFVFVDEVYKIDGDRHLDQDDLKENDRDITYRLSLHHALNSCIDALLAGPYIEIMKAEDKSHSQSFNTFLASNRISLIDYNAYEIVSKSVATISSKTDKYYDTELSFDFKSKDKSKMLIEIVKSIDLLKQNAIIYCPEKIQVERFAKKIALSNCVSNHSCGEYADFIKHIKDKFKPDWSLIDSLEKGIGIHHGMVPKYIQKEMITLFNEHKISVLLSTTTITEGVNTTAKNIIVLDSKKGSAPLKRFDAKNIAGRAGRFNQHYSGRVIVLMNNFKEILESPPETLEHTNFDVNSMKTDVDVFCSDEVYLSDGDRIRKSEILAEQNSRDLPDNIMDSFKTISRLDKIKVYDAIKALSFEQHLEIDKLMKSVKIRGGLSFRGFQVVLDTIRCVVNNAALSSLIDRKVLNMRSNTEYSLLTNLLYAYLKGGFLGSVNYKKEHGKNTDTAIRETSFFVYNTLKYQVVKYLGLFNLMYKYHISTLPQIAQRDQGLEILLMRLEYNAVTQYGRLASDYGVPSSIVEYYEKENRGGAIRTQFDRYELSVFEKVKRVIEG